MGIRRSAPASLLVLLLAVILGLALFSSEGSDDVTPGIDVRATELRSRLGPLCNNFDFQTKERTDTGMVRPVNCQAQGSEEVQLVLFVFSDTDTRDEWLAGPTGEAATLTGRDWAVVTSETTILEEVRQRLGGD
jgi:hypothetical protein